MIFYYMLKALFIRNPIQDGGGGGAGAKRDSPYQFFLCNFCKHRNYPLFHPPHPPQKKNTDFSF